MAKSILSTPGLRRTLASLHWKVPTILIASWILGLVLAIAHHLYYNSLHGHAVESQEQQTWATRIGTGLALVIKEAFAIAITTTCAQILWHDLLDQRVRLSALDSLFGMTTNPWNLLVWRAWVASPLVALFALCGLLLSFVTVVTPATLTVHLSANPLNTTDRLAEPTINYNNASVYMQRSGLGDFAIPTSTGRITRLLTSVATQGKILALPVPSANSSYSSQFYGLSLTCDKFSDGIYDTAIQNFTNMSARAGHQSYELAAFAPLKKLPTAPDDTALNSSTPNALGRGILLGINATVALNNDQSSDQTIVPALDNLSLDASRWYVIMNSPAAASKNASNSYELIECKAYNSSFTVDFVWQDGQQQVSIRSVQPINGVASAALQAATTTKDQYGSTIFNSTQACLGNDCGDCPQPEFAYLTVLQAFGRLLSGLIVQGHYGTEQAYGTSMRSTILAQTPEMPVAASSDSDTGNCGGAPRLDDDNVLNGNVSMDKALEQLMQNITISLFSIPTLLKSEKDSNQIELTIRSPMNVYRYDMQNLLLAYGLAFLVTTIAVFLGLWTIIRAHGSFDLSFSTFLRTTRDGSLDQLLSPEETRGFMPVPKSMNEVLLAFQRTNKNVDDGHGIYSFVAYKAGRMEASRSTVEMDDMSQSAHEQLLEDESRSATGRRAETSR